MQKHKGFTLIELVVVVMILGILAAVAAPKLLNTSGTATDNGLRQTLNTIRDAIERYAAENGGQLPGADGNEATFKLDLAEYFRGPFPVCPVGNKNNQVEMVTGDDLEATVGAGQGWKYSSSSGEFICNSDAQLASDPTITYDKL